MSHESRWRQVQERQVALIPARPAIVLTVIVRGMRPLRKPTSLPMNPPSPSRTKAAKYRICCWRPILRVSAGNGPYVPLEALRAQAIVARTFTLAKMEEGVPKRNTQASTDPNEFQAYNASRVNDRVKQAVADTRGRSCCTAVNPLTRGSSCSGGITPAPQRDHTRKKPPAGVLKNDFK